MCALVACYSGHAAPGAPCTPSLDNCPEGQSCVLVAGAYICSDGVIADAHVIDAAAIDTPRIDGAIDAAIDAPPPPWALVQNAGAQATSVAIAASGAKHLIVVGVETSNTATVTSIADNAGNTYVMAPGSRAKSSTATNGIEIWYAVNSKPGATTITPSGTSISAVVAWEVANIRTSAPLDSVAAFDEKPASTTPTGAAITTTSAADFVVSICVVDFQVSGLHGQSAFTNDQITNGNGFAHLTSNAAPAGTYQAQWDQPTSGVYIGSSAAFFIGP